MSLNHPNLLPAEYAPIRSKHRGGSNSTEQPSILQGNRCCRSVAVGVAVEGGTEGHSGEGTPVEGIPEEGTPGDTLVEGTLVEGKRPSDTLLEDNLAEEGRRRGVVAGCNNSCFDLISSNGEKNLGTAI